MLTQSTTPYDEEEENCDNDGSKDKEDDWDNAFNNVDTYSWWEKNTYQESGLGNNCKQKNY